MTEAIFLESIKFKDGVYHNLDLHLERIERTVWRFFGKPPSFDLLAALPTNLPKAGLFKVRLIYGPKVESVEAAPYQAKKPRTLELVLADRIDYGHKYLDRMALNDLKAKSQADDIIMVQEGLVTDSTIANLVFENKDGLFTPKKCLLPGVKREALLKSGQILPKTIKVTDLSQYSKVFLINAMIDLEDEVCVSNENIIPG